MYELRIENAQLYTVNARSITRMGHRRSQPAHEWGRSCREPAPPEILPGATADEGLFSVPAVLSQTRLCSINLLNIPLLRQYDFRKPWSGSAWWMTVRRSIAATAGQC